MDSIMLWARHGEAMRQAISRAKSPTSRRLSEELTDEFVLLRSEVAF